MLVKVIFIFIVSVVIVAYFLSKKMAGNSLKVGGNDEKIISSDDEVSARNRGEEFELKRKNFLENTLKYFSYLVEDFGYDQPEHLFNKQDNGTVTRDQLRYKNEKLDRLIVVSNSYHPYDYGFDIYVYRISISIVYSDDSNIAFNAISVLKENQDLAQSYIQQAAREFKDEFLQLIKGEVWR